MEYKNVTEIVFSPTGGTKKVANILADAFGKTIEKIDLTKYGVDFTNSKIENDSLVVIAAPVYEGIIPGTAIETDTGQRRKMCLCCGLRQPCL